jgi:hypothetical protein
MLLLLFPFIAWGQQTGNWGTGKLRESVVSVSSDIPYALVAYDFTERYLTQLQSMPAAERKSRMERDDVRILQGGLHHLNLIDEQTAMNFSERENRYTVSFANESLLLIELSFPASCRLLTGMNLKELENAFVSELSTLRYVEPSVPLAGGELKKLASGYYMKTGDAYYMEEINNHLYYEEVKGNKRLVFSKDHPAESVFNLLLSGEMDCDLSVDLTVRRYGLKKDRFTVPLRSWIKYAEVRGCRLYAGIEALDTDCVKAYVFAVNTVLKYNHVMNVEVPYALLGEKKGTIAGDITLFVPTHNISSLFGELNGENTTPEKKTGIK